MTLPDQTKLEVPAELTLPRTLPPLSHQTIAQQLHSLQGLDTDQHLMDQVVSVIECVTNFSRFRLPKTPKGRQKFVEQFFSANFFLYSKRFLYAKRSSFPAIKLRVIFTFGKIWFRLWNSLSMQGFFYMCLIALLFNRSAVHGFASSQAPWELTPRKCKLAYHLWAWNGMWMYLSMRLVEVYISVSFLTQAVALKALMSATNLNSVLKVMQVSYYKRTYHLFGEGIWV